MDVKDMLTALKFVAALLAALWGGMSLVLQLLIILMAADILSGFTAAFITKTLNSDVSFRGIVKKALILLIVGIAFWLEPAAQLPIGEAVAGFYCAHEGLSVLENAGRAGLPVPKILKDAMEKLNSDAKDSSGTEV